MPAPTPESIQSLAETRGIKRKESTANGTESQPSRIAYANGNGNTRFWVKENVETLLAGVEKYLEEEAHQRRDIKWGVVWNILSLEFQEFQEKVEEYVTRNVTRRDGPKVGVNEFKTFIASKYNSQRQLFWERREKNQTCYANVGEERLKEHHKKGGFWREEKKEKISSLRNGAT